MKMNTFPTAACFLCAFILATAGCGGQSDDDTGNDTGTEITQPDAAGDDGTGDVTGDTARPDAVTDPVRPGSTRMRMPLNRTTRRTPVTT